ncbi:MAG: CDP-glycerol glycerophosphotransferase family protein [Acutalibacteraceae bacterium]
MKKLSLLQKKLIKILKILRLSIISSVYCLFYYKGSLNDKLVAVESRNGAELAGNVLRIMQELSKPEYGGFRFILSIKKDKKQYARSLIKHLKIKNVLIVKANSLLSLCFMSKAKYLINDSTYKRSYVKKKGQIYINTWHGTPLKHMGRDNDKEIYSMGNVARNLLQSDYILFPNKYMMNIMIKAYSLENLYKGTFLLEGYPRNSILFESNDALRETLGLKEKQVIAYMPTWRGTLRKISLDKQKEKLGEYFNELDNMLSDNQIMYIKTHPLMNAKDCFSGYKHIANFPDGFEPYEILSAADILITDYSSVLYDFAVTGRKIILFAYDLEEYMESRGTYVPLSSLPFPITKTVDGLIDEINSPKNYNDSEFLRTYCPYEKKDAARRICKHVFLGEKVCEEEKSPLNGKNCILLYGGGLTKNGLTSAFLNMLCHLDKEEYNYVVSFRESALKKKPDRATIIPKEFSIIPISSDINCTVSELLAEFGLGSLGKQSKKLFNLQKRLYEREISRHFGDTQFSDVIQFCGYEQYVIEMFRYFKCNRIIYVHSDMISEIKERKNQKLPVLHNAYKNYDTVAIVSKELFEPTFKISQRQDNIVVAPNFQDPDGIANKSKLNISFESDTNCITSSPSGIEGILNSSGIKFISIGRFSREKGHERLIAAFERFHDSNKDAKLIIIGGHGNLFVKTLRLVKASPAFKDITIIRSIMNPMPILKRCDAFVLSSYYEGFPVVLFEAAVLGLPAFGTDVRGIRGFVNEFGGCLYENSVEGILRGMNDFAQGRIKPMKIDFAKYNNEAMRVYKSLLSTSKQKLEKQKI